ncbi:MAG: hypothetical protein ABI647_09320 [Gemmatimonadota bacterium]
MLFTLAFRHLFVRPARALFLLLGYGIGAGVMMVLLSIGEAMLLQSQDVALVGGGEVTVLPEGIDLEGLKSGSMGGMFFGIDRARFVERVMIGGPRFAGVVQASAPVIEQKLLYLTRGRDTVLVRAGGEIPSRSRLAGAGLPVTAGRWEDAPEDRRFVSPTAQQLYDELDHFHRPRFRDPSWGEWQYYNVVAGGESWYITYLVGGDIVGGDWGGQLLVTSPKAGGASRRFLAVAPPSAVHFDTLGADLTIGPNTVRQRNGIYTLDGRAQGAAGEVRFHLDVTAEPHKYFPPIELSTDRFVSGYVVPALRASVSGEICVGGRCTRIDRAPGYHDHNWGVWKDVIWEWGQARGDHYTVVYGGVRRPDTLAASAPFFLAVLDSLGVSQVLRFDSVAYGRPSPDAPPTGFDIVAATDADTVKLTVRVDQVQASEAVQSSFGRAFLQMRGEFKLEGTAGRRVVSDFGTGFFETFLTKHKTSEQRR